MGVRTGILERFYFGGVNLRPPDTYAYNCPPIRDEVEIGGVLVEDQPEWYNGQPDELRGWNGQLGWSKLKDTDQDAILDLQSQASWIDFADWRWVTERFSSDGTRTTIRTRYRKALSVIDSGLLPLTASSRYATVVKISGSVSTAFTIGTADENGRLLYTFDSALPAGVGVVSIHYVPIRYVRIAEDGFGFAVVKGFQESYQLKLEAAA